MQHCNLRSQLKWKAELNGCEVQNQEEGWLWRSGSSHLPLSPTSSYDFGLIYQRLPPLYLMPHRPEGQRQVFSGETREVREDKWSSKVGAEAQG